MIVMQALAALFLLTAGLLSGADIGGIWTGEIPGRNGEKQDLSFQFRTVNGVVTGVMFGDEFDLPVQDFKMEGDHVSFVVVSTNFYDHRRVRTAYSGTLTDNKLELARDQIDPTSAAKAVKPKEPTQIFILKRLV